MNIMKPKRQPTKWEIRYWINDNLSSPPQMESFPSAERARERREEVLGSGHPTHIRLFPVD